MYLLYYCSDNLWLVSKIWFYCLRFFEDRRCWWCDIAAICSRSLWIFYYHKFLIYIPTSGRYASCAEDKLLMIYSHWCQPYATLTCISDLFVKNCFRRLYFWTIFAIKANFSWGNRNYIFQANFNRNVFSFNSSDTTIAFKMQIHIIFVYACMWGRPNQSMFWLDIFCLDWCHWLHVF